MKPISKETIEHADDFIFHLSDSQVKEFLEDLKKKQPNIYYYCKLTADNTKHKERIDFINRWILVIFFCFNDYDVKLPAFSEKEIDVCNIWYVNKLNSIIDQSDKKETLRKMGDFSGQSNLIGYFFDKFDNMQLTSQIFKGVECGGFVATGILFSALYTQKIEKLLPSSSN